MITRYGKPHKVDALLLAMGAAALVLAIVLLAAEPVVHTRAAAVAKWQTMLQPMATAVRGNGVQLDEQTALLQRIADNVETIKLRSERPPPDTVEGTGASPSPVSPVSGGGRSESHPRVVLKGVVANVEGLQTAFRLVVYFEPGNAEYGDWTDNELDGINCRVDGWNLNAGSIDWISDVPSFRLLRFDGDGENGGWHDVKTWRNSVGAADVNKAMEDGGDGSSVKAIQDTAETVLPSSGLKVRQTETDLRSWVHAHYSADSPLRRATVNPRSFVWKHLRQDHGFEGAQVDGLEQWEALALHDAVHPRTSPLVSPWR